MKSKNKSEDIANWNDSFSPPPDLPKPRVKMPDGNHVLCRSKSRNTAVYRNNTWDFNPYSTSTKVATPIYFDEIFKTNGKYEKKVIGEVKLVLYHLFYHSEIGLTGRPSTKTLHNYWHSLRKIARFCKMLSTYSAIGKISIEEFVGNPRYVAMYIKEFSNLRDTAKTFPSLMHHLQLLFPYIKWRVVNPDQYAMKKIPNKQHVAIPIRIYLELYTQLSTQTAHIHKHAKNLANFIEECVDPAYARNESQQYRMGISKDQHRPYLSEAIKKHDLNHLFTGVFTLTENISIQRIQKIQSRIYQMQYVLYHMILFTTGMRDQELLRAKCNCIKTVNIPNIDADTGIERMPSKRNITLISSTTKHRGYEAEVSWIATEETLQAVEAASILSNAIAKLYGLEGVPHLFLSSTKLTIQNSVPKIQQMSSNPTTNQCSIRSIIIESHDFELLQHTDTTRDFNLERKYAVGQPWPLTGHQHRRSIGYYAYNSSLISESVLMQQFKHRYRYMTRYYGKHFEQLTTIFGFYDSKKKTHVIPQSHIALEYQTGMSTAMAEDIIQTVLMDSKLSGGVGTFLEKQKIKIADGTVDIRELKEDTIKRADEGFISFRKTLLGGCAKEGACDLFMLGDYASCIPCDSSIIIEKNKSELLSDLKNDLALYKPEDAEHQLIKENIRILEK